MSWHCVLSSGVKQWLHVLHPIQPLEPSSFRNLSILFSFYLPSSLLLSAHFSSPLPTPSFHFSATVSSLSIIVYLHSVHFPLSLMALRWAVFLVRNCNEDWNTISWMATVSFHPPTSAAAEWSMSLLLFCLSCLSLLMCQLVSKQILLMSPG